MASISLGQAIRNAIEAERASGKFYLELIEYTDDSQAQEFFKDMARQEEEHAKRIEEIHKKMNGGDLPSVPDQDMDFVETVPVWKDAYDISYHEALDLARDAENQAMLYYDAIADSFEGEVAEFFRTLAKDEQAHAKALEELIARDAGKRS